MNLEGKYISVRNTRFPDKPNEDYCLCDNANGIYILLDGVTRDKIQGKYPNPSPALCVSELFAFSTHEFLKKALVNYSKDILSTIRDAMKHGNSCIASYNNKDKYTFMPGTVGIVLWVRDNVAYSGFIGDCFGRIVSSNNSILFTRCQTEYVHKREYTTHEIRNVICNNVKHPAGYGVLNGQENALDFIELGEHRIAKADKILLYTDGFEKAINTLTTNQLYDLTINDAKELSQSQNDENADDKTIVIISYKGC